MVILYTVICHPFVPYVCAERINYLNVRSNILGILLTTTILQTPVPPLIRPADVTPVFNEILMREQEEEFDGPPQKEIPALIVWTLGGKSVSVEGSWDNWKSR
jgi:hypothetical protein